MPRGSSGAYTQPGGTAAVSRQTISSAAYNLLDSDIGQELTNSLDRLGRGGMQAVLPMNGFRISGLAQGVANNDAATVSQLGSVSRSVRAAALGGLDTATVADAVIYWNYSASGSSKTQSIPAASSCVTGQTLVIKDRFGDAAIKPIVITPLSGTIDDQGSLFLNIGKQSFTLVADPASNNWMLT